MNRTFRALLWTLLAGLMLLAAPVHAQSAAAWTAWIFDPGTGQVSQVNAAGEITGAFSLPLGIAFDQYTTQVAASPSGAHVAYIMADSASGTVNRQLMVHNVASGATAASYSLDPNTRANSLEFNRDALIFDEASMQMAFGYTTTGEAGNLVWRIVIIDYRTGLTPYTLRSEDASAAGVPGDAVPVIGHFRSGRITFFAVPVGGVDSLTHPAFVWDTGAGTVTPATAFDTPRSDYWSATGEFVVPAYDDRLAGAQGLPNTVQVYDSNAGVRFPFYHDAELSIRQALFVQNGERVLVQRYDPATGGSRWALLDRDGTLVDEPDLPDTARQFYGTVEGFVYLENGGTLVRVETREALTQSAVWSGGGSQVLIYVNSAAIPGAYIDWARLAGAQPVDG
jgi:hypothetical protein